jgi:hypothetical protein
VTITRPCYATREQVMRAVDIKYAAHMFDAVDRAIESAADNIDGFMKRQFYPIDQTISFDWPSNDSPTPWRIWLNQYELAAQPTLVVSGTYLVSPVVITPAQYTLYPSSGPPWNRLELRRDLSASFGYNSTPQNDIGITGTFGYWTRTRAAGKLAVALSDTTGTTAQVSNANLVGVGDLLIIGTERMLVTGKSMVSTGVTAAGLSTAQVSDSTLAVPDATVFSVGEVLLYDSERVLIVDIAGNNLFVKRAWDGTTLTDHTSGTLYADRQLTITRGDLGSVAATHLINAAATVNLVPSQIRDLALGEAMVQTANEVGAYSGGQAGTGSVSDIGSSLADKWEETETKYGRKIRTRAV